MRLISKIQQNIKSIWIKLVGKSNELTPHERIARLERNYLVLLKRLLEMDGVKLVTSRSSAMTSTVLNVNTNDDNKGLNEFKPTIH